MHWSKRANLPLPPCEGMQFWKVKSYVFPLALLAATLRTCTSRPLASPTDWYKFLPRLGADRKNATTKRMLTPNLFHWQTLEFFLISESVSKMDCLATLKNTLLLRWFQHLKACYRKQPANTVDQFFKCKRVVHCTQSHILHAAQNQALAPLLHRCFGMKHCVQTPKF